VSDFFAPDSVIRRVNAEPVIMLGAGRALLLQVAHPVIARGVAEHSNFRENPFARLQATAEAMYAVVFGSRDLAHSVAARVRQIHEGVAGPGYRANDVENLLWVHATLCDSAIAAYTRFLGPLGAPDLEAYYQDMNRVGELFGVRASVLPCDWRAFRAYFDGMVAALTASDLGRELADDIVLPPRPAPARLGLAPLCAFHRLVAVGTTPARIRAELRLRWSVPEQQVLDAIARTMRLSSRVVPRPVRVGPFGLAGWLLLRDARAGVAT
jgi:uncharacterized protein (DUF2236 family)